MWYITSQSKKQENISTCIILKYSDDNIEVLLVKRGHEPHKDEWCIPGGHIEENESSLDAVIREVKEETNINLNKNNLILVDKTSSNKLNNSIYAIMQDSYNEEKSGSDAKDIKWIDVSDLPELIWNNNFYINKALKLFNKNL